MASKAATTLVRTMVQQVLLPVWVDAMGRWRMLVPWWTTQFSQSHLSSSAAARTVLA